MTRFAYACLCALLATTSALAEDTATGVAARQIAAEVPATDIWLVELPAATEKTGPVNITNRPGYDNQPAFVAAQRILYTSIRSDGQSDIYSYDRQTGETARLTRTPESEYSPTPVPDGSGFSVVRVEADGAQWLWAYSADGAPRTRLLPGIDNVGYHAWISADELAVFLVDEPPVLRVVPIEGGAGKDVASGVGRGLAAAPQRRALAYTRRDAADRIELRIYDAVDNTSRSFGGAPGATEDLAWMPDGRLLMSADRRIFIRAPDQEAWRLLADLSTRVPGPISRLAIDPSGRWLAFVVSE